MLKPKDKKEKQNVLGLSLILEPCNCSTPSEIKISCLGEHYYQKILLLPLVVVQVLPVSHLLPRPTEKINYSAPTRDIDLKFRG